MEFWTNIFKVSEKNANVNNSNNLHENIYLYITTYCGFLPGTFLFIARVIEFFLPPFPTPAAAAGCPTIMPP